MTQPKSPSSLSRKGGFPVVIAGLISLSVSGAAIVNCGSQRPPVAGDDNGGVGPSVPNACNTPNLGCPCVEPGLQVDCGRIEHIGPDGWVACSLGKRTCGKDLKWGDCIGEGDVVKKNLFAGGGIHSQTLGASAKCPDAGPTSNLCDPYCNQFLDDSTGGLDGGGVVVVGDGGITINPAVDGGSGGGGGFNAPQGGASGCSPNRNLDGVGIGPADCTSGAGGLVNCQQDFRCDPVSKKCLWNGATGYYDPSAAGPDLTVEAPCGPQGSATSSATVCNRGNGTVPAGSAITFHITNGPTPPDACTTPSAAPDYTYTLGADLAKGACASFLVGNSTGAKFITVNWGATAGGAPAVTEAAGHCANNSAYFRTDGSGGDCSLCNTCSTQLTGTIKDPRGVNPLPDVTVYVPTAAVSAFPAGMACDSCSSLITGTPWSVATTDYQGKFTIDVPPNQPFPLVIQAGRWRRRLQVKAITACTSPAPSLDILCNSAGCSQYDTTTSTYTSCSGSGCTLPSPANMGKYYSRLPGKRSEGDIPRMAVLQSGGDQLECLLRKIGIDDSEFKASGAAGAARVDLYRENGMTALASEGTQDSLWGNPSTGAGATLSNYAALVHACHLGGPGGAGIALGTGHDQAAPSATATAAQRANMKAYTDAGGRLFGSHWWSYDFGELNYPAAVSQNYGTWVDADRQAPSFDFSIDTTTQTGQTFSQWANLVGSSPAGLGTVRFLDWRHLTETVNAPAIRLAYGDSRTLSGSRGTQNSSHWTGPIIGAYQFDTPFNVASPCGRIVMAQSHVSQYGISGTFPAACNAAAGGSATSAMTPQETAFEFMFFSSQACLGLVPTPPPPATQKLATVTFTRDYQAVCPSGTRVRWGPFYWEAVIPTNTSIDFRAASAETQAGLPTAPGTPPTATSRAVGSATTTVSPPAWDCDGCPSTPTTVDYHLYNDAPPPNMKSAPWLRIFMTFNPDNSTNPAVSPTLTSWRQVYDCVPAE